MKLIKRLLKNKMNCKYISEGVEKTSSELTI